MPAAVAVAETLIEDVVAVLLMVVGMGVMAMAGIVMIEVVEGVVAVEGIGGGGQLMELKTFHFFLLTTEVLNF